MPFPFDKYPWLNFQELNLAYFIKHFREIFEQWNTLLNEMYEWKDATNAELEEWKSTVETGISSWETGLQQSMENWKDETETDISAWKAATLAALDAWKTATTAVFEQIRTEAAASATAAAGSATSAQTALAGAQAAQAAAETAAAGIQSELTQIQTNTADIADLKTQLNDLTEVIEPHDFAVVSSDYLWGIPQDMTATFSDGSVTFSYPYASGNKGLFGLYFDGLVNGESYDISFDVTGGGLAVGNTVARLTRVLEAQTNLANIVKDGNHYACTFTASISELYPYNGLSLQMQRAISTTVTIANLTVIKHGETERTVINNEKIENLPETALNEDTQALLNAISPHLQETSGMLTEVGKDNNLLKDTTYTPNKYINGSTGAATTTGSSYAITGFIALTPGKTYYYNKMFWGYWAFYSSNSEDSYIDGLAYQDGGGESSGDFTVPDGAYYGRFTVKISNEQTAWINTINKEPTGKTYYRINGNYLPNSDIPINPCDYSGNEITIFNKILCIGDSLTAGVCNYRENGVPVANVAFPNYAYPKQLNKISNIEVTNMGLAGLTTEQWYNAKASADLSGYEAAIIMLGVNDAIQNNGWTTAEETALTNIITKLQNENTGIKIYIATIIPSLFYVGAKYDSVSEGIRTFVENADDENIILFDVNTYGHTGEELAYNNGHLTAFGYLTLAKDCMAFISNHIKTNKMLYRFVQFIGTNHET